MQLISVIFKQKRQESCTDYAAAAVVMTGMVERENNFEGGSGEAPASPRSPSARRMTS